MKSDNKICILLIVIVIIILILYFYLNVSYHNNDNIKINDKFENLNQSVINELTNTLKNAGNFYTTVKCKYIKIERIFPHPETNQYSLNIARVYIYDANNNLINSNLSALAVPVYPYGEYPASNLINYSNTSSFAHTGGSISYRNPYFRINLSNERDISKIVILNRQDGYQNRMIGTKLSVYDNNNNIVYTTNINKSENNYTFNFTNSQASNIINNINSADLYNLLNNSKLNETTISNNLIEAKKKLVDSIKNMSNSYKYIKSTLNGYVVEVDIPEPSLNPSATLDPATIITEPAETESPQQELENVDVNIADVPPAYVYDIASIFENFNDNSSPSERDKKLDKFANHKPLNVNSFEPFEDWRQEWNQKIYQTGLVVEPESIPNGPVNNDNIPLLVKFGPYPVPITEINNKIVSDLLSFNVRNSTNQLLGKWKKNMNK